MDKTTTPGASNNLPGAFNGYKTKELEELLEIEVANHPDDQLAIAMKQELGIRSDTTRGKKMTLGKKASPSSFWGGLIILIVVSTIASSVAKNLVVEAGWLLDVNNLLCATTGAALVWTILAYMRLGK